MKTYLYRLLIEWRQASGKPLPGWLKAASERDPSLRQSVQSGDALTRTLRSGLDSASVRPMAGRNLRGAVLQRLAEQDQAELRQSRGSSWRSLVAMGGAAAALAIMALGIWHLQTGVEIDPVGHEPVVAKVEPVSSPEQEPAEASERSVGGTLVAWEAKATRPLEQEIDYLIADARGALDFLAAQFVPQSSPSRQREQEAGPTS